jgi:hypothetical protein
MHLNNHMRHVYREIAERIHERDTGEAPPTRTQLLEQRRSAAEHHRLTVDLPARNAYTADRALILVENVRTLASELADLLDHVDGPAEVNVRALIERLRAAEVNLEAACGELARELGMVTVPGCSGC